MGEGRREIEAAKLRLNAAKKQMSSASQMMEAARKLMETATKEVEEAELFLKETEKRLEVIDVDDDVGNDSSEKDGRGNKRRKVSEANAGRLVFMNQIIMAIVLLLDKILWRNLPDLGARRKSKVSGHHQRQQLFVNQISATLALLVKLPCSVNHERLSLGIGLEQEKEEIRTGNCDDICQILNVP
mmetsp:Transcript_10071/g.22501  ORF Transcript_10071/g.22501 Transcript_10071/m.22501 type:complete len:186 (-) Transcript_10071:754-1311(-)